MLRLLLLTGGIIFLAKRSKNNNVAGIGKVYKISGFFEVKPDTTLEELKRQYYKLAKIYHPDTGGTEENFKALNNEYEKIEKAILSGGTYTTQEQKNESEISEIYREIIDSIITIPGIIIEIIGTWIWISGITFPVKEQLKESGFKFHHIKKMWFWHAGDYHKRGNKEMDINEIRVKYGSETIRPKQKFNQLSGTLSLAKKLRKLQYLLIKKEAFNSLH